MIHLPLSQADICCKVVWEVLDLTPLSNRSMAKKRYDKIRLTSLESMMRIFLSKLTLTNLLTIKKHGFSRQMFAHDLMLLSLT